MNKENILKSISKQGNGEIYLGVVGAVRTGKSTFIKKFIENLVVPNIVDDYEKKKCLDELPQSGQGKIIMTTEPKFVPSSGANIKVNEFKTNIKLVDCVGYVIEDSQGFLDENGNPRMVKSPWYDDYIPLTQAAEIGTEKVIKDHATIAIVVTTDGSITDIKRESYEEAEVKVINELKEIGKPFIIIMNSKTPNDNKTINLAKSLETEYNVPVITKSVEDLKENDLSEILKTALYEFPISSLKINIPKWIDLLPNENEIKSEIIGKIKESITDASKLKDIDRVINNFDGMKYADKYYISELDTDSLSASIVVETPNDLFEEQLNNLIGDRKITKSSLLKLFVENKDEIDYKVITSAMKMAKNTGYSIVYPSIKEMKLETPEIIKQGSRYGVKLKATASSVHMLKVDVTSTFEPIIGSEEQSKELINYIMKDYETDKNSIWSSEIFGRSLEQIVKEGIEHKLLTLSDQTRIKLANTVTKIVNKGANNLIAIVL